MQKRNAKTFGRNRSNSNHKTTTAIMIMILKVLFCHNNFSYEASGTAKDKQDMITELNVMKRLKPHPHVLKLIGCCSISGKSGPRIRKII